MDRGAWQTTVHGVAESDMTEQLTHTHTHTHTCIHTNAKCSLLIHHLPLPAPGRQGFCLFHSRPKRNSNGGDRPRFILLEYSEPATNHRMGHLEEGRRVWGSQARSDPRKQREQLARPWSAPWQRQGQPHMNKVLGQGLSA